MSMACIPLNNFPIGTAALKVVRLITQEAYLMTFRLVDVNSARELIAYKAQIVDILDQISYAA